MYFLSVCYFVSHTAVLKAYFWLYLQGSLLEQFWGDLVGCWALNLGWPLARKVLYLLYHLSEVPIYAYCNVLANIFIIQKKISSK